LPIGQRICVPSVNNNNNQFTTASPFPSNCQNFYTIFSGDTCTNIAGAFRTTIAGLQQLNPGLNCASLPIGQRICVPTVNTATTASPFQPTSCVTNNFYVIQPTDTCTSISGIFSLTTFNLQLLNPGLNCLSLPVNQRICVPSLNTVTTAAPTPFPSNCQNFYTIFSGDTCTNIAGAFRTTIAGLQQLNPSLNCASLPIGQRICVPAVNQATTVAPSISCSTGNTYVINTFDSCTSIGTQFGTTGLQIQQLNSNLNCLVLPLPAGQRICVPNANNVQTTCSTGNFYTVFSGDTCTNIAGAFRTTIAGLQQLNPGFLIISNKFILPFLIINV
jgi:spore germination protein YaaH